MAKLRPATTLLASYFKLSSKKCPQSPKEEKEISPIPYASVVGSLIYVMICTMPDLTYAVSKLVHVKSRKVILRSSEVGATISARDCESKLGVSEIENKKT